MKVPETNQTPGKDIHFVNAERLDVAGLVAGQIAHDFNNLLTPLLTYPELIRNEINPNPLVNEYISIIEKTATEMLSLTQKLLSLARRGRLGIEVYCLNDAIGEVMTSLQASIPHGVTVKYELAENLPDISGNRAQMHSALENLCQNALEAMGVSGTLTIKSETVQIDAAVEPSLVSAKGEFVKISLFDTGAGIAEDIREKIFDPFFTTKRSTKKRGSGLGLSIALGIVKDHRGYVELNSTVGQGSTFCLYFPALKETPRTALVPDSIKGPESIPLLVDDRFGSEKAMPLHILIADDELMIRRLFGMIISSEFREALIEHAADGKEAVAKFSKGRFDLIVMDLQMPGQDGRESFFEIQRVCLANQWTIPPIIFCTGFTPSESLAGIIKDSSIHCLLRKPIKAENLLEAVRTRLVK